MALSNCRFGATLSPLQEYQARAKRWADVQVLGQSEHTLESPEAADLKLRNFEQALGVRFSTNVFRFRLAASAGQQLSPQKLVDIANQSEESEMRMIRSESPPHLRAKIALAGFCRSQLAQQQLNFAKASCASPGFFRGLLRSLFHS